MLILEIIAIIFGSAAFIFLVLIAIVSIKNIKPKNVPDKLPEERKETHVRL